MWGCWTLALLSLFSSSLAAGDLESWNYAELKVVHASRVDLGLEGALFVRDSFSDLFDRRVSVRADVHLKKLDVVGGYLIRRRDYEGFEDLKFDQRLVGGVSYPLFEHVLSLQGYTAYERVVGRPDRRDYNRYRQIFSWQQHRRGVSPFVQSGFLWERSGFVRYRVRAGLDLPAGGRSRMRIGYQFDSTRADGAYHPRHVLYAKFTFGRALINRN